MKNFNDIVKLLRNKDLLVEASSNDLDVEFISYDSREVEDKTLFFCKGVNFNESYLFKAREKGATAYISERRYDIDIPYIIVKDIRRSMMVVASYFYDYPDRKLKVIGVTGTKGKSTTVEFIRSIFDTYLHSKGRKSSGIISSIEIYDGMVREESKLTTPEALVLFKHLKNAVDSGLEFMIVEVSSQALKYDRVNLINFDMVCFLNIGRDHISPIEHTDFEDYFSSKLKIFSLAKNVVYNLDSDHIDRIREEAEKVEGKKHTFSLKHSKANFYAYDLNLEGIGYRFKFDGRDYRLKFLGDYNVENALAAIAIANYYGIDYDSTKTGLLDANILVRSRLFISKDKSLVFFVDYAHNDLSFKKVFKEIKKLFPGYTLYSIFGASGGKAQNRKKDLSEIGGRYSDKIFFVPDDPGFEEIADINKEMESYISNTGVSYESFDLREAAIKKAFEERKKKTVIFIAGKGGEPYQYIKGDYIHINSDLKVAKKLFEAYEKKYM